MNLAVLDKQRQDLVKEALSKGEPGTVQTAILEVEYYSSRLSPDKLDEGIAAAEILLALEKKL